MSSDAVPPEFVRPRPGLAKALGVLNLVISASLIALLVLNVAGVIVFSQSEIETVARPAAPEVTATAVAGIGVFGLDDPAFLRFTVVDAATGLILDALMFATGIGLVNLRPWGARWWPWVAWAKIIRLFLVWGLFVVFVIPSFSERVARYFVLTMPVRPGRGPDLMYLTRACAVINLVLAAGMIVLGSIYPAVSLWLVGRPGVRAALGGPGHPGRSAS